jgi:sodium-dependent dicarboxylate transporter 2/3/5
MAFEEKAVLAVFATVGTLWIGDGFLPAPWRLSETSISMIGAVRLFLLPAGKGKRRLMGWPRSC